MYVSSTLSYLVRTVILLYLINSTSAYRKQNLTVKNDYTSEISEKARKDFRSPRRSSADKSLRESDHKVNFSLREGHPASLEIPRGNKHDVDERFEKPELQNLSTGEAKKNDTSQTGIVKRTKRCLFTMMALGGIASMAADWLLPEEPKWTPPAITTTTARPVWHPPKPVYQPPKPVFPPPKPVYHPPKPVYQPPKPVYQPPKPVYQPPKPVYHPPPPVHQPPKPVYQPPKPVYHPPPPVHQPPKPVYQPPKPVYHPPPPVYQLPPTTTTTARPVYQPPPTTTTTARPVSQPPPTTTTTTTTTTRPPPTTTTTTTTTTRPPPTTTTTTTTTTRPPPTTTTTTTTTTRPPPTTTTTTTTTTRPPPTTTTTEEPTTTNMHPTIDSTTLLPDVPTTIWTPYKLAGVDTSIAPEDPQREFQEPASEYDSTKLKIIRDKWINATGGATEMGLIVVDGVPEYNISTATFVTKTKKKTAFNDIDVVEFLHPLTEDKIIVPLHGGDEYVNPETREVFIIVVDNAGRTFLIFKGIDHSITAKYPDRNSSEDTWNIIVNEPTNIERVTKWGSLVAGGVPKYNLSEGTIVNSPQKATSLNGTEVLEFVHPFTNETVQVPLNGGDEFVKRQTGEVYIIIVDNQNRTILIFKGIDHSITGQYPDRTSGEDIWNIIVNETTNIERVTKWGSLVAGGVPKYNLSEGTIVNNPQKATSLNGTEVLEFVHPFTNETVQVPLNGGDEFVKRQTGEVYIIFVDNQNRTILIFKGIDHSITGQYPDTTSGEDIWNIIVNETTNIERVTKWGSLVVGGVPEYNISEGTIVNKPQKATSLNGTEVLEFVHPFTNETVQLPLNGGDEFVKRQTGEVYIIFVDNQNRTILIFKGIDHSITGQYPDRTSGEDIWNIIVNETTNIERVTKWGSIVVGGVPKYNISEGTIVNKSEKKTNANGIQVLEFVHPFTNEIVEVPLNGGDEFVKRKTREVYIIFVDIYGRTLLIFKGIDHSITEKYPDGNSSEDTWNIIVNETTNIERVTKWGSIVVGGVPKYNISEGTIVNKSEKKINSNGTEVLEFVHPFINEIVEVPLNGGDEFVKRETREVYIIFVDIYGRTLLIFKGIDHSITEKYPNSNSNEATWNVIVNDTTNIVTEWGSIVIRGVPKYNISEATIVNETEQKTDSNGNEVLEFVHPFTNETVQVSLIRGDEFVRRKTLEVFKIFVDIYGRTLLIFKGIGHSIAEKYPDENNGEDGWNIIVNGTTNIVHVTKWGSLVVGGVPKYNISEATIVNETARKTDSNGTEVLEFMHPFTNEIVEVPVNVGDEFVKRKTREVYIIFVDNQNRTILIFKGIDHSLQSPGKITKSTDSEENIYENSTTKVNIVNDEWGSLVVGGVPKYDIDSATIVTETNQMIVDGIPVLEFAHPVTQDKIRVPLKGGDEYIDQTTKEIFIIFVDIEGKTLLILKHEQPMENIDTKENSDAEKIISQSKGGSIVVNGIPEYNISSALIITKTNKKISFDGTTVLEFVHPITQEVVQVPLNGGDEYVIPKTQHIFIIFVDVHKRTLLILKDTSEESTDKIEDNIDECWGTMVVGGNPKYDIANATIVEKTRQKMKNGVSVIEFTHPITLQVINVPYKGGDEYVDPMTKQIFIIFVDILDRTILILRPSDSSVDSDEDPNAKEEDLPQTNQGSIVVGGVPKYDIASAMVVKKTKQRMKNGSLVVDFEHPITSEVIHVALKDGDEYVDPKTKQVFIIFVDVVGRTILILKRSDSSIESQQTTESYVDSDEKFNNYANPKKYKKLRDKKKWGTVVVRGVPRYYMSRAKIVMDVEKKIGSNGVPVLEFNHPITGQTIEVPVDGGDEYVNGQTREVFVICVDRQGRTLLVFKGLDTSASTNEMSNDNAASYNENSAEYDAVPDLYSNVNANVVTPDSMPFEDYENVN